MKKTIQVEISLDDKRAMETKNEADITSEVFDSMAEAIEIAMKDRISLEDDDFCEEILGNYQQTLPEDFKDLKNMGFKVEVK